MKPQTDSTEREETGKDGENKTDRIPSLAESQEEIACQLSEKKAREPGAPPRAEADAEAAGAAARESGARKVFFASAAPPVRFPNVYGIDMPTRRELIATERNAAGVAEALGADAAAEGARVDRRVVRLVLVRDEVDRAVALDNVVAQLAEDLVIARTAGPEEIMSASTIWTAVASATW